MEHVDLAGNKRSITLPAVFSKPVLILNVYEVCRTKRPCETSAKRGSVQIMWQSTIFGKISSHCQSLRGRLSPLNVAELLTRKLIYLEGRHTHTGFGYYSVPETLLRMLEVHAAKDGVTRATRRAKSERVSGILCSVFFECGCEFP